MRVGATATAALRQVNKTLALEVIREKGVVSRAELSRLLGLTRSTMSLIIEDMVAEGLVRPCGIGENTTGRKPMLYECDPTAGYVLGLDIGGTNIKCHLSNLVGQCLYSEHWETFQVPTSAEFMQQMVAAIRQMIRRAGLEQSGLKAMGVASPGVVDPERGIVLGASPNLPEWNGLHLGEILAAEFKVPVRVENDVNSALIGEHVFGVGRGRKDLALIAISTGIGGALMLGGEIHRGATFGAGEIGYWLTDTSQIDRDWKPKGALESTCSATAIAGRGSELLGRPATAKDVFDAARQGNSAAQELVREIGRQLGMVASNLTSLLDMDMIILGGGVMLSGDLLLPIVREVVERHAIRAPEITTSGLADEAGVLGAVHLALGSALPEARLYLGGKWQ